MVPVASTPSMITRPPVGSSSPAMMLKIVLLPQPEGPIRLTKRPCGIVSVTGASAWNMPAEFLEVIGLERHADVVDAKLRGRGRHAHSLTRATHGILPDPGPSRKSRASEHGRPCVRKRRKNKVPARGALAAIYSKCIKLWQRVFTNDRRTSACSGGTSALEHAVRVVLPLQAQEFGQLRIGTPRPGRGSPSGDR